MPYNVNTQKTPTPESMARARAVLRDIKHRLNQFSEDLWLRLVRARNHLLISIAVTGFVTHLLLCITILLDQPPHSSQKTIIAATMFYLVGAISGLFGRFYQESTSNSAADDHGLFLARMVAVPLLSGLAGIGGVFITAALSAVAGQKSISTFFDPNSLQFLFIAAIFGFAPNQIFKSLQQRSHEYATLLEKAKVGQVGSGL